MLALSDRTPGGGRPEGGEGLLDEEEVESRRPRLAPRDGRSGGSCFTLTPPPREFGPDDEDRPVSLF